MDTVLCCYSKVHGMGWYYSKVYVDTVLYMLLGGYSVCTYNHGINGYSVVLLCVLVTRCIQCYVNLLLCLVAY